MSEIINWTRYIASNKSVELNRFRFLGGVATSKYGFVLSVCPNFLNMAFLARIQFNQKTKIAQLNE